MSLNIVLLRMSPFSSPKVVRLAAFYAPNGSYAVSATRRYQNALRILRMRQVADQQTQRALVEMLPCRKELRPISLREEKFPLLTSLYRNAR